MIKNQFSFILFLLIIDITLNKELPTRVNVININKNNKEKITSLNKETNFINSDIHKFDGALIDIQWCTEGRAFVLTSKGEVKYK